MAQAYKNEYWLLRHGRSKANEREIIISKMENGVDEAWTLAPAGEEQAREAGRQLRAALSARPQPPSRVLVFASPFSRTQRTAALAVEAAGLQDTSTVQTAQELRERFFGDELEMQSYGKAYGIIWEHDAADTAYRPGTNGETVVEVATRIRALIERLESQHTGEVVLLVSHGDTLSITQAAVLSPQDMGHHRRYAFNTAELRPLLQAPADGAAAGGH